MSDKPLVEITVNDKLIKVYRDGSYEGEKVTSIRVCLPPPIEYSQTVRDAAKKANEMHNAWQERWHKDR